MNTEHLALLQQAPASTHDDDTWARLCCEQALLALEEGCYAVGALLVDGAGELLCSARNQVFTSTYSSAAHAEMQVLDQLESEHAQVDRRGLTLYVSLEPCLMCYGRILLAGITRVRYLARDRDGGFALRHGRLPPAWANLASGLAVVQAKVDPYWLDLAEQLIERLQDRRAMRERVLAAWRGGR
ncbi:MULTISPECIES: nucleoside deaminase [Pseudomonadaceae]|jgi:tRNA(Arg) A34 adenosine deaminase TadA|uniref:CMP/dCMP deaminase zinc-binding protein n=2 Tax=Ectopseudomonas oleovorans TaxID=301 RepID=A0A061CQ42_ECTOL|nr:MULTISPECIES: nucleoside deaminase [Pseudomonas]KFJ90615.1 dCMP deaminase [Pseudomonas sp. 1-7]AXO61061.1 nucleoside deaminase [Pseudomonas sp. phDV1]MBN7117867.1 dCMP deaminase [Pseudomonas oleovorans]MBN7132879.1 dCMP deaminase [Pseudomonas oleovorans]MBN7142493.1 dCMP deaminase [Pseudomonas oleovorans]